MGPGFVRAEELGKLCEKIAGVIHEPAPTSFVWPILAGCIVLAGYTCPRWMNNSRYKSMARSLAPSSFSSPAEVRL